MNTFKHKGFVVDVSTREESGEWSFSAEIVTEGTGAPIAGTMKRGYLTDTDAEAAAVTWEINEINKRPQITVK
jgi:hypothetical protein